MNPDTASTDIEPATVYALAGWRRLMVRLLGRIAALWGRSLRFVLEPEDLRNITKNDEPLAIVLWHNRLFLAAEVVRRFRRRPAYALVSASRDGAWLTEFFSTVGLRTIRGSSSRFGREAAAALIERLRSGCDVGITPDGPRGPMYDFKGGAYIVTRRVGVPALLIGGRFEKARRLKSWDGFYLPLPFSRVHVSCRLLTAAELRAPEMTLENLRHHLLALNPD